MKRLYQVPILHLVEAESHMEAFHKVISELDEHDIYYAEHDSSSDDVEIA